MAWCPNCKNEYRDGIFVCADCGATLVEELVDEAPKNTMGGLFTDEQLLGSNYQMKSEDLQNDGSEDETFEDETSEDEEFVFKLPTEELSPEELREAIAAAKRSMEYTPYRNSSQSAEENRSSGWILLVIGSLGIVAGILCLLGVIPLRLGNPYLFYGVMFALFILFIVMGVVSIRNAKIFERKAQSENSLESSIVDWALSQFTMENVDAAIGGEGEAQEVLFFKRSAYMKSKLNHSFMNLDQGLLDYIVDEILYDRIFSDEK